MKSSSGGDHRRLTNLVNHANTKEIQCFFFGSFITFILMIFFQLYLHPINQTTLIPYNAQKTTTTATTTTATTSQTSSSSTSIPSPAIPMIEFPEPAWRTAQTMAVTTVASTPFARFEIHQVKTENGEIIKDWLWTDERSHVNILIHLEKENKYLLFYQKKYGLERSYYAAAGGLFNLGDTPTACANRELLEETGLETKEMIYLGRYRVQVNRGGGILHAFYAKNAYPSKRKEKSDDYEKQEKRLLTRQELIDIVLKGEVGEAQWLATIAIGLLYEENKEHHPTLPSPPSS